MAKKDAIDPPAICRVRDGEILSLEQFLNQRRSVVSDAYEMSINSSPNTVPLNQEALSVLLSWKSQPGKKSLKGYVFASVDGRPIREIGESWERLLKRAGVSNFGWHDLRHNQFAGKLVMAGENLNTVRELLGHADYKMTLRYAHLAPEHKASAVAKL